MNIPVDGAIDTSWISGRVFKIVVETDDDAEPPSGSVTVPTHVRVSPTATTSRSYF